MSNENETIEVISIYFGKLDTSADFTLPIGQEQITSPIYCLGFIKDGEILGYAIEKNDWFILENSEELDSEELRNSLPDYLTNQWNRILLSSIDIEELDDEADMEFFKFDLEAYDSENPFEIIEEIGKLNALDGWLSVYSIKGWFNISSKARVSTKLKKFLMREMEEPISLGLEELGDFCSFDSPSELLVLFNPNE